MLHIYLNRNQNNLFFLCKVFVQGSSRLGPTELGSSFGYLKASSNLTTVNLYIMPYNYLELSTLLSITFWVLFVFFNYLFI